MPLLDRRARPTTAAEIGYECGLRGWDTCRREFSTSQDELDWYEGWKRGRAERLELLRRGEIVPTGNLAHEHRAFAEGAAEWQASITSIASSAGKKPEAEKKPAAAQDAESVLKSSGLRNTA